MLLSGPSVQAALLINSSAVENSIHEHQLCTVRVCLHSIGAGAGEGDSYSGVHVHDGPPVVGAMDHLVHQTVRLPLHLLPHSNNPAQGTYIHVYAHIIIYMYMSMYLMIEGRFSPSVLYVYIHVYM